MAIWVVRGFLEVNEWLSGLSVVFQEWLIGYRDRHMSFKGGWLVIGLVGGLLEVTEWL